MGTATREVDLVGALPAAGAETGIIAPSGASWSGATWSGATWSGGGWSGATWSGTGWE